MMNDLVADTLTRIRNASKVGHKVVRVNSSKLISSVLSVLKDEGFISGFKTVRDDGQAFDSIDVSLKYLGTGSPVIKSMKRVSRSGQRSYSSVADIPKVSSGLGIVVLSTSAGVMSDREARRRKIGGEVLAFVG